jgi:hypothetical protein
MPTTSSGRWKRKGRNIKAMAATRTIIPAPEPASNLQAKRKAAHDVSNQRSKPPGRPASQARAYSNGRALQYESAREESTGQEDLAAANKTEVTGAEVEAAAIRRSDSQPKGICPDRKMSFRGRQ